MCEVQINEDNEKLNLHVQRIYRNNSAKDKVVKNDKLQLSLHALIDVCYDGQKIVEKTDKNTTCYPFQHNNGTDLYNSLLRYKKI